jgi:uncharacterized protein YjiS (DUF1127 family)
MTTMTLTRADGAPTTRPSPSLPSVAMRVLDKIGRWHERHRQRRALLGLSDDLLKDIGVSRADAWREAAKPFWRE